MSTDLIVLGPEADHAEAARVMQKERVKRIPVLDDDGALVGLVSRSDILRVFARSDQEIIDEIRGHIMGEVLWIDPGRVDVRSNEGNVVLSGRLETRSDVDLLDRFTARVDGVVSVASHLDFEIDDLKLKMAGLPTRTVTPRTW